MLKEYRQRHSNEITEAYSEVKEEGWVDDARQANFLTSTFDGVKDPMVSLKLMDLVGTDDSFLWRPL